MEAVVWRLASDGAKYSIAWSEDCLYSPSKWSNVYFRRSLVSLTADHWLPHDSEPSPVWAIWRLNGDRLSCRLLLSSLAPSGGQRDRLQVKETQAASVHIKSIISKRLSK